MVAVRILDAVRSKACSHSKSPLMAAETDVANIDTMHDATMA